MLSRYSAMNSQQKVRELAHLGGLSLRTDYSGRGMFGQTCMGVVCDKEDYEETIEKAAELGLSGHRTDDMGRQMIIYYPQIKGNGGGNSMLNQLGLR